MIVPYIIHSLDLINLYMFNTVFVKKVLQLEGSYTLVGFTGTCFALANFIWKPIAGNLSDKHGTTKLLFWCLIGYLLSTILCAVNNSLILLCFSRLISASASPIQVIIRTIVTNIDRENQSKNLSKLGVITAVSFIIGSVVCGQVLSLANGVEWVYFVVIVNTICSILLTAFLPQAETANNQNKLKSQTNSIEEIISVFKSLKGILSSNIYRDVFLLKALTALSSGNANSNIMIIMNNIGIVDKNIGYIVALGCVVTITANIVHIKIKNNYYKEDVGYTRIVQFCFIVSVAYFTLGITTNVWIFVIFLNVMAFSKSIGEQAVLELLLNKITDNKEKTMLLGCFESVQSLADLIAPIVSSLAFEISGKFYVFLLSAILMFGAVLTAYRNYKVKSRIPKKTTTKKSF